MSYSTRSVIVSLGIVLAVPLLLHAQTAPFNVQECLTARGAASPPSLQDLQACTPKPSAIRSTAAPSVASTPTNSVSSGNAASCPNLSRTLQKGSSGTDVTSLQSFLIQKGHLSSDSATGYFGSLTEAAVQKFQCAQLIVCSGSRASTGYGLVGAKTRAAIQRSCSGTNTTTSTPTPTSSSGGSMMDTLSAQIKLLQERIAALKGNTTATTQTTPGTQTTQSTQSNQSSHTSTTTSSAGTQSTQSTATQSTSQSPSQSTQATSLATSNVYACTQKALATTPKNLIDALDVHLADFGDAYANSSNREGILGNNEPSVLDALLDAYMTTNNTKYLQQFVVRGDRVLGHRDDNAGYTNYRGVSSATWSNKAYSQGGQYVSFLVEDGALIGSLAHFASIVKNNSCLKDVTDAQGRSFDSIASTYIAAVEQTIGFHHENWHTGTVNGSTIGYYTTPTDATFISPEEAGRPVPVNYQAAMGTAFAYLYGATKNASYAGYAQAIANFILLEMGENYHSSVDAYTWPAWPQMKYWSGAGWTTYPSQEDLSHSIVTAEFARAMYEQGAGSFYSTEMQRIAHVYSRLVYTSGSVSILINGTGGDAGGHAYQYARSAMLTPYDPYLWSLAYDIAVTRLGTHEKGQWGSAGALTGLARLARYYPQ